MLELIQFAASPYCIIQRRLLEYAGTRFKVTDIPSTDRSLVWKLTRHRYYHVPILVDGDEVLFETDDNSQVIAKYLDQKLQLGLFPKQWEGVQDLIWRFFENEIEAVTFKLNDIYWEEQTPAEQQLAFLRHKERKFGRGCLQEWKSQQSALLHQLEEKLIPAEEMLGTREFLLEPDRPLFVDFDLFGMLGNFLFSGHYQLPGSRPQVAKWYERMAKIKSNRSPREKLHS